MVNLAGKRILITGGAGSLGREAGSVARGFGADVILVDLAIPDDLAKDFETVECDLRSPQLVADAVASIGRIDALFNIAGGFDMGPAFHEISPDAWQKMFAINVETARNITSAALPQMLERGRGAVVNIGAVGALHGAARMSAYCASKSVVMNMTESLSEEVKSSGINVNAVLPSVIDTAANRAAMPDADYSLWVSPAQLSNVMCFLASELASGVHGALIPVKALS